MRNIKEAMKDLLNKIHHADCLEFMKGLPDKCVDMILTDPPYGEQTHKGAIKNKENDLQIDFASISEATMLELTAEFLRLSRTWVVFTCEWRFINPIEKAFPAEFVRFGIWTKPVYTPQISGDRPAMGWEAVCIMHPKGMKRWNGGGKSAVYNFGRDNDSNIHTTQKPLQFWKQLLLDFNTTPKAIVLDCFSGSGTTALACHDLGLDFICIEKDLEYFNASVKRLEQHQRQLKLL